MGLSHPVNDSTGSKAPSQGLLVVVYYLNRRLRIIAKSLFLGELFEILQQVTLINEMFFLTKIL